MPALAGSKRPAVPTAKLTSPTAAYIPVLRSYSIIIVASPFEDTEGLPHKLHPHQPRGFDSQMTGESLDAASTWQLDAARQPHALGQLMM